MNKICSHQYFTDEIGAPTLPIVLETTFISTAAAPAIDFYVNHKISTFFIFLALRSNNFGIAI